MSKEKDYDGALFFYIIGLIAISISVGTMSEHYAYGWVVLGGGLMCLALVSMILTYLEP